MHFDVQDATDTQLLARFEQNRDQSAFAELVKRHGQMVTSACKRVVRNKEDAEDAFQATFFALARAAGTIRRSAAVCAWLHRTAVRCAIEVHRSRRRQQKKIERMKDSIDRSPSTSREHEPSLRIANQELSAILDEELCRLPPKFHTVIVLCELEGMTQKQAAKQLDVALSTVAERVVKGRELLRHRLVRRGATLTVAGLATCLVSPTESSATLTTAYITKVTKNATLYAAGQSGAVSGMSSAALHVANKVITAMNTAKLTTVGLMALAIVTLVAPLISLPRFSAHAGTLFEDSFADGDFADGSPVSWIPAITLASLDASSGDLFLRRTADTDPVFEVSADAVETVVRDVSVRMVGRPTDTNSLAGIVVRTQSVNDTLGYFSGIGHSAGGSVLVAGIGLTGNEQTLFNSVNSRPFVPLPYDVRNFDTVIQLDVFGDRISVWAWQAGTRMPDAPQFEITDPTYSEEGHVRVLASRVNRELAIGGEAVFRSVHVANVPIHELVPEPTAVTLGLFAFGAIVWQRRHAWHYAN